MARADRSELIPTMSASPSRIVTRRHFDVAAEGLRHEIELIADGHTAVRDDVAVLKLGQQRLEAGQGVSRCANWRSRIGRKSWKTAKDDLKTARAGWRSVRAGWKATKKSSKSVKGNSSKRTKRS